MHNQLGCECRTFSLLSGLYQRPRNLSKTWPPNDARMYKPDQYQCGRLGVAGTVLTNKMPDTGFESPNM